MQQDRLKGQDGTGGEMVEKVIKKNKEIIMVYIMSTYVNSIQAMCWKSPSTWLVEGNGFGTQEVMCCLCEAKKAGGGLRHLWDGVDATGCSVLAERQI